MTLYDLEEGQKGIITKVRGRGAFRKRIMEMGFVVGKVVSVGKKAPLKNPIEYSIMGYDVSLRNSEAELIEVEDPATYKAKSTHFDGMIDDEEAKRSARPHSKTINIALIGNPNCGKTTLFNYATSSHEKVGNYSGVTVDAKKAKLYQDGYQFNIIDLPGTYSITSYTPEELFVRNYLFDEIPDIVVNVIDSSNLERNLYLTTQLIDLDLRVVIALNMYDELEERGDQFDYDSLGKMIGVPMVPTVSSKGKGIKELFSKVIEVYEDEDESVRHIHINYGHDIEESIVKIQNVLKTDENKPLTNIVAPRYSAIKLLEWDKEEISRIREYCANAEEILTVAEKEIYRLELQYNDEVETIITDHKYGFVEGALMETYKASKKKDIRHTSRLLDNILTNKYLSYPTFIFIIWLMFQTTFSLGEYPMSWIEELVGILGNLVASLVPEGIIQDLLVDGIIGGVGGVIVFLPNILILFFFISIMEDTGYMARVAFIVDKIMHRIGLHGRSFIPMLMGFGCNVPAIMATRTIGGKNDRIITMLINPFMSCSARLPVYVLIIGTFFPNRPGLWLFLIYGIGIVLSMIVAIVFKKTLFKASEMPFVMELPPYRMPTIKSLLRHTWYKGSQYLKKMGGIILIASIIIWILGYFPRNTEVIDQYSAKLADIETEFNFKINTLSPNNDSAIIVFKSAKQQQITRLKQEMNYKLLESSMIGKLGKFIEPAFLPLGFDWKMSVAILAGIAAKEIVVSTMGVLNQTDITADDDSSKLSEKLKSQTHSHPSRYGQKVFSPLVAFSFLIFILIYFPCVAVISAVKKESGYWKWAIFMAVYTTGLAWILSFIIYQVGSLF